MPGSIGPRELIIVLVIALIVLGPKKLPEVGGPWAGDARVQGLARPASTRRRRRRGRRDRKPLRQTGQDTEPSLRISRALLDEVIAHAREEAPNECCGLIASRDGVAVSVRRVRNIHASPLSSRWTTRSS